MIRSQNPKSIDGIIRPTNTLEWGVGFVGERLSIWQGPLTSTLEKARSLLPRLMGQQCSEV